MTPTLTLGDLAAMVSEASRRGANAAQAVVEEMTTPDRGNIQGAEDILAVAALAEVLRFRVDSVARGTPGMPQALEMLRKRVADVLDVAVRIEAGKREVVRG